MNQWWADLVINEMRTEDSAFCYVNEFYVTILERPYT